MLINKDTKIVGKNIVLVSYKKDHVIKYHSWMQSEELQTLTGSLPLTLEKEYEMQESWLKDTDKCTFIILDKEQYLKTNNEIEAMIGDTNLFLPCENGIVAEAEIMIAEPWARRKRRGWEAMLLMLLYGITHLNIKEYVAKIISNNIGSIKMFLNMGFIETSRSQIFNEITFNKIVDDKWIKWLEINTFPFEVVQENDFE